MVSQINQSVGVAPFVIVPGDQFNEGVIQSNTSSGVEDAASGIMNEIGTNNFIMGNLNKNK